MNIYDIDRELMACVDAETGEVIDPEKLEALTLEREVKIENIACWIKNLEAEAAAIKAEEKKLSERASKCAKNAERLKAYLTAALNGAYYESAKVAVTFRRSEQVNIADETAIPTEYMVKTESVKPDKTAIKNAIKSGKTVDGCELIEKQNIQIK